ncbi:MAG: tRNA (adenosine(37)-N6)-threonylcarbamoyltransferase complex transferase subunit TsaD [Clostridiales bacterium]|jgi:N6-L-threonylcarbamoyladenine synthase|nr:tRNA (adenosine(37)-N6)-threonylcarbamoyltransferase complex transferase subunit TsaD [Clostridiales bacterium]
MPALILGVETSCDETSAAVVADGRRILSNAISSQIDEHAVFGGVVPEIASRRHVEAIIPVIDEALSRARLKPQDLDAIAVTYGPGLAGALLVGLSAAKGLAFAAGKPLIGVHHIEAHICANYIEFASLEPPFTALVASGGHSHIYLARDYGSYLLMGRTRDDAAGEVFDKVARAAGLGYPGGPKLDAAARGGNPNAMRFPRTHFSDGSYDFSFSGVKTAALNCLNKERQKYGTGCQTAETPGAKMPGAGTPSAKMPGAGTPSAKMPGAGTPSAKMPGAGTPSAKMPGAELPEAFMRDFFASFQNAVVDALVGHAIRAEAANRTGKIVLAGGVAANSLLRARLREEAAKLGGVSTYFPQPALCTDNAAMVAGAAYSKFLSGDFSPLSLNAAPGAQL